MKRRPTDGDAAHQLRLALRALRVLQRHLRTAALDSAPRFTRRDCRSLARNVEFYEVPHLLRLIDDANQHVAKLRKAKRKAVP